MNCPNCSSALSEVKEDIYEYFQCSKCGGVLAKGHVLAGLLYRLEKIVESENLIEFESIKVDNIYSLAEQQLNCPNCSNKMEKFNYAYDSNVFADKCPKCQYVWLNKGEIEKIAKHIAPNPSDEKIGTLLVNISNLGKKREVVKDSSALPLFSFDSVVVGDEAIPYKFPFITITLIVLNALLMWFLMKSYLFPGSNFEVFLLGLGNVLSVPSLSSGIRELFLIHLFFNSLLLWIFGDNLEDSFGHFGFLLFYIVMWVVLSILFITVTDSVMIMVGYNSALSALIGAYFVLYPDVKLKIFSFFSNTIHKVPANSTLLLFISQQIFPIFIYGKNYKFGYLLQIVGFLLGCFTAVVLKKFRLIRIIKNFSEFD